MPPRRHRRLADRFAARSLALALVEPTVPRHARADALLGMTGERLERVDRCLEQAVRLVELAYARGPRPQAEEAVDTLRLAARRAAI